MGRYGSGSRADVLARQQLRKERLDADPPRCRCCDKVIPPPRRYLRNVTFYSEEHRDRYHRERKKARAALNKEKYQHDPNLIVLPEGGKRGPIYDAVRAELDDNEWLHWINRNITDAEVGRRIGKPQQSVTRARRFATNELVKERKQESFELDDEAKKLLGPTDKEMRALLAEDPERFEERLVELALAFVAWRSRFFRLWDGIEYYTGEFHMEWIVAVLRTIYTGTRLMILSPPRHGKTDLMIHFCVWLICRNPDIRILYCGPNIDIAENCVGQVKNLLSTHTALQKAYLGPNESWEPESREGKLWRDSKFRVGNRTFQQKQPTMWATGPGAKTSSIDADWIIVDDPADPDDSQQLAGRLKIAKWLRMKILTRKMRFSGLSMVSSRVHYDDLYAPFLDNPKWTVIVNQAHNAAICGLELFMDHSMLADPNACVLFPEMNPIDHLRDQHDDVGDALFDMMFQNLPHPESGMIFDVELIKQKALNRGRGLGLSGLGNQVTLVAGIDPATRNTQASFLWGLDLERNYDYMIDLETDEGGGIVGALNVIRRWYELYDCQIFVIEDVGFQELYLDDPRMKELKAELGIAILPCSTGMNKHDPHFGISGMADRLHTGRVDLPYATPEARRKVDKYLRELIMFSGDGATRSKHKSDVLMASWVPYPDVIRKLRRGGDRPYVQVVRSGSYPDYASTQLSGSPWGRTEYPS